LKSSVEKLEGYRVRLTVESTADEVRGAIDEAYARISRSMKLPGFRPGKAPRPLIDTHVGREKVLAEALEELVETTYPRALGELDLRPMERPDTGELDELVDGEGYTYTAEFDVRPDMKLTGIDNLTATVPPSKTTDAEIDAQIDYMRDRFATLEVVEDRGVADGDFALISFVGTVDGEAAEDLTVDKYLYEVGKGIMPKEFDEGLIGTAVGAGVHVEFPVPETAANTDYVGKIAAFDIEVHEIKAKTLAVADDAFAGNVGGFETMAELREDIRTKLDENKAAAHGRLIERGARESLAARLIGDVPVQLVDARAGSMSEEFFESLQEQGMTLEAYTEAVGITQDQIREDIAREAALRVADELALEALFRTAGLSYSEDELDAEIAKLAAGEKIAAAKMRERLVETGVIALLRERLMHKAATRWLMDNVEVVEADAGSEGEKPAAKPKKKAAAKKPAAKADDSAKEE